MNFYSEEAQQVLKEVKSSSVNGLNSREAERRLKENGKNKLKEAHKDSLFKKFLKTLADPMIIMLIAAAAMCVAYLATLSLSNMYVVLAVRVAVASAVYLLTMKLLRARILEECIEFIRSKKSKH